MKLTDISNITEEKAEQFLAERRWGKGMIDRICPHCGSERTTTAYKNTMPYRCKDCRKRFSVRTGTVLKMTKIPLRKWLTAIYLLSMSETITKIEFADELGIDQQTAIHLAERIRNARVGTEPLPKNTNSNRVALPHG